MTTIIDRIDSAADRIRDDELLADKKRVTLFISSIKRRRSSMPLSSSLSNSVEPLLLNQAGDIHIHVPILATFQ
jgi:hypothetical protein